MFISDEERQILALLKSSPERFFAAGEICKHASTRQRFTEDPRWALPHLRNLLDKGLVERDAAGHYRLGQKAQDEQC